MIKKILATLFVFVFFLFFWLNGPLQIKEILINLEHEDSLFSSPIFVGNQKEKKYYKTVGEVETEGYGWSLFNSKNEKEDNGYKLLSSKKQDGEKSKDQIRLLERHLKQILKGNYKTESIDTEYGPFLYVRLENENLIYLENQENLKQIRGYGGAIKIGVLIHQNGAIKKVQHISSKETQSYLTKIANSRFYEQFEQIPLEKDQAVDAVSGATLTTEAIAKTANALVDLYRNYFIDKLVEDRNMASFKLIATTSVWWILHISIIALLYFYGFQKKYKKTKRDVKILSLISILYIGFFLNSSFTYVSLIHPFLGTTLSPFIAFYSLLSLLGSIWSKNIYCQYVCPYGHLQRISLNLSKKRFVSTFFIKNQWIEHIRNFIAICLITGLLLGLRSWGNFEVFPDVFGFDFTSYWFGISILLVLVNLKYPFIWCRIACPTGAVLDKISDLTK